MISCHYEIIIVNSLRNLQNNIRDGLYGRDYMNFKMPILNHDLDSSD